MRGSTPVVLISGNVAGKSGFVQSYTIVSIPETRIIFVLI